jgi:hypothetical protein
MKQFTQGIPEQSDEPQEAEEPDMPQNTTEPEDPEFHSYLETLVHIREFIELAAEMGDEAGVEMGKKGLWQLHGMVKDYFQDTCPGFPPPVSPPSLGTRPRQGRPVPEASSLIPCLRGSLQNFGDYRRCCMKLDCET